MPGLWLLPQQRRAPGLMLWTLLMPQMLPPRRPRSRRLQSTAAAAAAAAVASATSAATGTATAAGARAGAGAGAGAAASVGTEAVAAGAAGAEVHGDAAGGRGHLAGCADGGRLRSPRSRSVATSRATSPHFPRRAATLGAGTLGPRSGDMAGRAGPRGWIRGIAGDRHGAAEAEVGVSHKTVPIFEANYVHK